MGRGIISSYVFFILFPWFWILSSEPLVPYDKISPEENLIFDNAVLEDCPTAVIPIFTDEIVCNGSQVNVPPDEVILENVDIPENAVVVWDADVTAPVFNPGASCDIIIVEFHYSIHCTTDPVVIFEGGIHTVEVWPEIQPPIVTVDEFCNYGIITFCPTDIVDPPIVDPGVPVQEFTVFNAFGCAEVFMVDIPSCFPPIEVGEIGIIPVCHEYLVTFDIFGGTGNYVVNGVALPPGQMNYISNPLFCETPYFFDVTDDIMSSSVVVSGDGPICPPPLEVSPPTIEIIGNQYQITFLIFGGTGEYIVNGMPITGDVFVSDLIDCGLPYEFLVYDNCSEIPVSGGPVQCYDPIEITNLTVEQVCDEYIVNFDISGGTGSYVVNGVDLPPGQTNYTSPTLICEDPYNFDVTDDVISDNVVVQDDGPDCFPPVEVTAPVYNITGGHYEVTITISGGSGNYFVDGVPLAGNIFVSEPIECGQPFIYEITDECEETVTVEDVFICYDPISVINLTIDQICNEYQVSFEIVGGTGNYVINGTPLPPGQSTVTSQLIPCGLGYSAQITDDQNTSVYDLIGEGPDCLPPLEVTDPLILTGGNTYQVLFQVAGGTGNYTVDGTPISETSFISDHITCGEPFSFVVSDGCEELTVSGGPVYCVDPISVTNLQILQTCNEYIVSFTIIGGTGNYVVNGSALPPGISNVVSQPLPCGTNFFAEITDDLMTSTYELNGTGPDCLPPLEVLSPQTLVVGAQYQVIFEIVGGTGNYTVDGVAIPGNSFASHLIECGLPFSFIVTDGCEEFIVSGDPPDCFEPISIANIEVVPTCNFYNVFFTVSGGSGNYVVNGTALPPGQSNVVSLPLDCGTEFNIEVTDDIQSDLTVVSGPGSDCLPPLIVSEPIINISNLQYEVTVTISGGTGNYTVDGISLPGNVFVSSPMPCGTSYSFELTDDCVTVPISGPSVECYDPITASGIETGLICDQYTAQFTASGGTGNYLVDGLPIEGNVYISEFMGCGEPFGFELSDDLQTGLVIIEGPGSDCLDPLETSEVLTGVIGDQYTAQFTPTGGTGNYAVDGIPLEGGTYVSEPFLCGEGFSLELTDGCETLTVFGGPIECYDPIIASEVAIGTFCDQYTAQFTLSGGTGEYIVDGIPLEGSFFVSDSIPCGNPFSYVATDNLQTDQVTIVGDGSVCPDPLETSEVLTGIIGNNYTAQFTPSGGSGNYSVDGIPLDGPFFVSDTIPCGNPFNFELSDGCETLPVFGGPIECYDPIIASEIAIGTLCDQYTAQFTLSGGTGNYTVNGIPLEGPFFVSDTIPCANPFNFVASDNLQTGQVTIAGDGPACPDPLEHSEVLTGVIGNNYTAQFTPSGGSGNYSVDGIPLDGPFFVSDTIPCGNPFNFELSDGCEIIPVFGGPIDCYDPLTVSEIMIGSVCSQYTAQFTMSGGSGNYLVDGLPVEGNSFISPLLSCGEPFSFDVTDDQQSNPVTVTGEGPDCPDPLAVSEVATGIIGNQYTAQFTPSGGTGDYAVDGIPLDEIVFISPPIPCGDPYFFTVTDDCEEQLTVAGDPPCLACPTAVGDFTEMSYHCDGEAPVFPTEEAILATLDIPSGEVFDYPEAQPLYYTGDGCTPQVFEFEFKVRCILDPTIILPAGTMTVMLYPEPQPPQIIQVDSTETGCIYEVIPNCPSDIVEPSTIDEVPAGTTGLVQTFEVSNEGCATGLMVDVSIPDCIIDKVTDPQISGDLSMLLHNNPMSVYEAIILIEVGERTEGALQIWDVNGRLVRTISHQVFTPGNYTFYWDGNTDKGDIAPSGIYAVELRTDVGRRVAKLVKLN
ncbi:MAG: hypothetical protein DWQ02_22395 [Bacteroidetes bacterium]|nr:MAG: hypothetical protein DWQ02_22395 [Bacteroidota bacterium]